MAYRRQQQHYLFLLGGLTLVLGTLAGIGAAAGGVGGSTGGGGGGGGARGSGLYNYGSYGGAGPGQSSGLGMRRGAGAYGPPIGLGNPHDGPRYLLPGQGGPMSGSSVAPGGTPGSGPSGKSGRLSAWGIITIVTFVILIGAGAYWGFICYPFFCKKERNYNMMMNMSSATTATPSTRSTEFEKLDHCCSKSTTSTRSNDTGISNI